MIELQILGAPNLRRTSGEETEAVHLQPKRLALLAYLTLASHAGFCRRDKLLALFWPSLSEEQARNALSQGVYHLRRALGEDTIISRGAEELRVSQQHVWCDAVAFEQALETDKLTKALDLHRGLLLDGLHLSEAPSFEHWLEIERENLRRRTRTAATTLAERDEAAGNLAGTAHWLRRLLELTPDDEAVLYRLMTVLDRLGDRTGALRAYETFARHLAQDLDLSPSASTRQLAADLRNTPPLDLAPQDKRLPSVAVLPFINLSAHPEQAYFCDGITEEIINALTQIRGLRVAARTSVFAFKDKTIDIRTLAQNLGVDAIIEGSVRQVGMQVRITAQLIEAANGYHLWSDRYDRPLQDIFAIQDEIATAVAEALRITLLQEPDRRQADAPTRDMEAHALYLKGLFHRRKRTPEHLEKACVCFQEALARDPDYAQAQAALAFTYSLSGWFLFDVFAPRHAYPQAQVAAAQALSRNDQLTEAHLALALVRKAFAWDREGAEAAFQQALALDPDNPDTLGNYASQLVSRQRFEEAIALTRRIQTLDPYWIMPRTAVGIWMLVARRFEEAIAHLLQAQEMDPAFFVAPLFLGDAYRFTGRLAEAQAAYRRVLELIGRQPIILGRLGALYAEQDQPKAALEIIEELHALAEKRYLPPSTMADIYLALNDRDRALLWLEKAYEARDTTLTLLDAWPAYDAIRSTPRFQRLLQKIGAASSY